MSPPLERTGPPHLQDEDDLEVSTEGPSWGHSKVVLGAIRLFLEPLCGHFSPKNDKVSEELTLRYPHEKPCVYNNEDVSHPSDLEVQWM